MRRGTTAAMAGCVLALYMGIVMYLLFAFLYREGSVNFASAAVFEIISFVPLVYLVISNILSKRIKTGYFVPLVMMAVIYTIVLDAVNIAYTANMAQPGFVLMHLILLFIYCLISMPIFVMGRR